MACRLLCRLSGELLLVCRIAQEAELARLNLLLCVLVLGVESLLVKVVDELITLTAWVMMLHACLYQNQIFLDSRMSLPYGTQFFDMTHVLATHDATRLDDAVEELRG